MNNNLNRIRTLSVLAILALSGTLFLAVLISRLIGTYGRTAVGKGGGKG